jgi:Viral (Superfamily 1) RNA helicase.
MKTKIKLLLQWGRRGKTYKMVEYLSQSITEGNKIALFTFAHINRIRIAEQVKERYNYDIEMCSEVEAAIPFNVDTWEQADTIYIDELGLFTNDNKMRITEAWIGKKDIVATGDVHQIQNSDILYTLILEALKQGGKPAIAEYNKYAEWTELLISEKTIEKYNQIFPNVEISIEYPSFPAVRNNLDIWETQGNKPFLNNIILDYFVKKPTYQILTTTTTTRDYLINKLCPEWYNNIKVGNEVFCKENDAGRKDEKRYINGKHYYVITIDNKFITLIEKGKEYNNSKYFNISKPELITNFQPPKIFCVQKGQGTDFDNVLLYVTQDDIKSINKQVSYTAVSRARNEYYILFEGDSVDEYQFLNKSEYIIPFARKGKNITTLNRLESISFFVNNNKEKYSSIKEIFQGYVEYKSNILFAEKCNVKYDQFFKDFKVLFPDLIVKKEQINMSVRYIKSHVKVIKNCTQMFLSDLSNNTRVQRQNSLFKLLNINVVSEKKDQLENTSCKPLYKRYTTSVQNITNITNFNINPYCINLDINKEYENIKYSNFDDNYKVLSNLVDIVPNSLVELNYLRGTKPNTSDIIKFCDMKLGMGDSWHYFFFAFGCRIKEFIPIITVPTAWLLAVHYLYYNALLYPEKTDWFTSEISNKQHIYIQELKRGLQGTPKQSGDKNKEQKGSNTTMNWNFNRKEAERTKVYATYEGKITARFTKKNDTNYTLPTSKDWLIEPPANELYSYNLYNTNWIVIDVDGSDVLTTEQQHIIDYWVMERKQQYFETKDGSTKHKKGCHIWINVAELRFRKMQFKGIDVLGNCLSQIVSIKPNKYPIGFNPNTDLLQTEPVFYDELKQFFEKHFE